MLAALLVSVLVFSNTSVASDVLETRQAHSHAKLVSEFDGLVPGHTQLLGLLITLDPGWHTYWMNPGDSASAPIVGIDQSEGLTSDPLLYPVPTRFSLGGLYSFGYGGQVMLGLPISLAAHAGPGTSRKVTISAEWVVCKVECLPAFFDFSITFPVVSKAQPTEFTKYFSALKAQQPVKTITVEGEFKGDKPSKVWLPSPSQWLDEGEKLLDLFPMPGEPLDNDPPNGLAPQNASGNELGDFLELGAADAATKKNSLELLAAVELATGEKVSRTLQVQLESDSAESIWWALVGGFLGGVLLNLMPCVFPVLSLKLNHLSHHGTKLPLAPQLHYTAGVLAGFWLLTAVLLGLRGSGEAVGWGFQLQSVWFVSILVVVFFLLGMQLMGWWEWGHGLSGAGSKARLQPGWRGDFATGLLAVLVATPCSAPFMGAAIGYALTQRVPVTFAVFTAMALGLAAPYLAAALLPFKSGLLPKPGRWMATFRELMGFAMWGSAIWLLYILSSIGSASTVALVMTSCLFSGMWVWIKNRGFSRLWLNGVMVVSGLPLLLVVLPGPHGSVPGPLGSMPGPLGSMPGPLGSMPGPPLEWQVFDAGRVAEERRAGRAVFINFTADWCITCKLNERTTLSDGEVEEFFREKEVSLFRADWTRRNPGITRYLQSYNRAGVPFYLFYPPGQQDPVVLPEILTPGGLKEDLVGFFGS